MNDSASEGKYFWADGESYTAWAAWKSDEPKDEAAKRCIHFKDGEWMREDCSVQLQYFCQYIMPTSGGSHLHIAEVHLINFGFDFLKPNPNHLNQFLLVVSYPPLSLATHA